MTAAPRRSELLGKREVVGSKPAFFRKKLEQKGAALRTARAASSKMEGGRSFGDHLLLAPASS